MKHLHTKHLTLFLFAFAIFTVEAQTTLKERLTEHVFTLASDSLQGREAGTLFSRKAADYIERHFETIGLDFFVGNSFIQPFDNYRNVVGVIHGNDSLLKNEFIVVGAHFDHIGVINGQIHNGADDNASGTAVMIELARMLQANQANLKRSVIFIGFDAEEKGLLGADYFAQSFRTIAPKNSNIQLMFSIDMVGWHRQSGFVEFQGVKTIRGGRELILDSISIPSGLNVTYRKFENSILTATDTRPFAMMGIPTLAVSTGLESPYHKPEDEAHLIDFDGMVLITEYLQDLIRHVAQDKQYAPSGRVARIHRGQQRFEFGIIANIGDNYHYYTAGAVDGKPATSFGVGLMAQFNFGRMIGIRPEIHYDRNRAKFPQGTVVSDNLTIPLNLVWNAANVQNIIRYDVTLGGYYAYRLGGKMGGSSMDFDNVFNREEWGITWGVGLYVQPLRTKIGFTNRSSLTNVFQLRNADGASLRNRTNYFTLTYIF